jgi:hypothetical protein
VKRDVVIGKNEMGMGDADDGIVNQLPIAAHMKLMLDAPESEFQSYFCFCRTRQNFNIEF